MMSTCAATDLLSATHAVHTDQPQSAVKMMVSGTNHLGAKATDTMLGRTDKSGMSSFFSFRERMTSLADTISKAVGPLLDIPPGWEEAAPLIKIVTAAAAIGGLAWWQYRLRTADPRARQARNFVRAQRPKDRSEKDWRLETDLMALRLDKLAQQNDYLREQLVAVQEELKLVNGQHHEISTLPPQNKSRRGSSAGGGSIHTLAEPRYKHVHSRSMVDASTQSVLRPDVKDTFRGDTHTANLTASRGANSHYYPATPHTSTTHDPASKMHSPYVEKTRPHQHYSPSVLEDAPRFRTPMTGRDFEKRVSTAVWTGMDEMRPKIVSGEITDEERRRHIRGKIDLLRYPDTNGLSPSRLMMQQAQRDSYPVMGSDSTKRKADETEVRVDEVSKQVKKRKPDSSEQMSASTSERYPLRKTHARKASLSKNDAAKKTKLSEKAKGKQNVEAAHHAIPESEKATNIAMTSRNNQSLSEITEIYVCPPPKTPMHHSPPELTTPDAQMMDVGWRHKNGLHTEEVASPLITMHDRDESPE